jgi:8-oxo-dGTP pyrophosphatase MutT (NUDIX family)
MRLLDAYSAGPGEQRAIAEMQVLLGSPHDVLSSYWFDPGHFTVSGFITDPGLTHLVLIHHRRIGSWLQPGGHIEPGDASVLATLHREIAEETGLRDLQPTAPDVFDIDVHRVPAHRSQPAHQHFDVRFHAITDHVALTPTDEVRDAAWVPLADVGAWTEDRSVRRAVEKLRSLDS